MGCFETNTTPPRQQRKALLRMPLERFLVVQLSGSDNEPEISMLRESLLKKLVDMAPVAPVFRMGSVELRRKFTQFEHELAENAGCDGRKCPGGQLE